jgi:dephospho-CoA kinase
MTRIIGLTGGIASGKSAVSQMLSERGALVIDADKVGHEAYAPGNPPYEGVIEAFGRDVVAADGSIDRRALGAKVFGDDGQRQKLQDIVWPWMRATMNQRLAALREQGESVVVLEAAVLIEADWIPLVDEVWLVVAGRAVARERLMARNGFSAEDADRRIDAQLTNEERARYAQVIIDNSGTLEDLERRVEEAWARLAEPATGRD